MGRDGSASCLLFLLDDVLLHIREEGHRLGITYAVYVDMVGAAVSSQTAMILVSSRKTETIRVAESGHRTHDNLACTHIYELETRPWAPQRNQYHDPSRPYPWAVVTAIPFRKSPTPPVALGQVLGYYCRHLRRGSRSFAGPQPCFLRQATG